MANPETVNLALSDVAARQLANATKTVPQLSTITPALAGRTCCRGCRSRPASTG